MSTHRFLPIAAMTLAFAVASIAEAISFNEVARFAVDFAFDSDIGAQDPPDPDNNPQYIGTNPLAVAWNGSQLYLGGHDNFGTSLLPIGLIEVLDATRTGELTLDSSDFSAAFGQIFQPVGRGYTGLELSGGSLSASYDNGSNTANAIQLFDASTNSLNWDLSAAGITGRGGSGIAFDPGFNGAGGAGAGVACGRRAGRTIVRGRPAMGKPLFQM